MSDRPIGPVVHGADAWRRTILPDEATLLDAIRSLSQTTLKIALIVTPDGSLVGTVTDGDIRRGLLNNVALTSRVAAIANRDPLVVPPDVTRDVARRLMQINLFNAIPIVDAERRLIGLHLFNDLLAAPPLPNLMVIMAGGRGSRLGGHTENCPKPLLPVGGKPMLEHIIDAARAEGFHHFVIAVHYLGHMIEDYFGDGSRWKVRIDYIKERSPLGTAGAVALLDPTPTAPFVVSNGDVLTEVRYTELLDFHCRHGAAATMAVRSYEWQHPFGVVQTSGVDIVGFEEKPVTRTHINSGIYVLEPAVLHSLTPGDPLDMPSLFVRLREQSARTIVYPMHEPWLDVGQTADLERARNGGTIRSGGAE